MRKVIRRCSIAVAALFVFTACDSPRPTTPDVSQGGAPPAGDESTRPIVRPAPVGMVLPVQVGSASEILRDEHSFFSVSSSFVTPTASGTPSLIWFANDGSATIWKMNGPVWSGAGATVLTIPNPWKLVAAGDLNGDGHPDLIWEATTDGTRAVTYMNGAGYAGSYAMMFQFSPNWKIVSATDFNADGKADLVVANTASGVNGVLYLNGTTWTGVFGTLPSLYPMLPVAAADMDGDSQPDLVFQGSNAGPPAVSLIKVVQLDGLTARPSGGLFTQPLEWRVGTAADFNDDGQADVVLQNISDGTRKILFMGAYGGYQPNGDSIALPTVSIANMVVTSAAIQYPVAPLNMTISNFYVTQGIQDLARSVPLIAGKPALVRVFVTANDYNTAAPVVRVRVTQVGGGFTDYFATRAANTGLPLAVSENTLRGSYNVTIPANQVVAGASVSIAVDPANTIVETSEADNTASTALVVRSVPRFDVRFVPVKLTGGQTGSVTNADVPNYMEFLLKFWPVVSYDADLHATFNSAQSSISTDAAFSAATYEILNLRTVEGSSRYYYGVLPNNVPAANAGRGYVGVPAAAGLQSGYQTAAHEWGHNFNRPHAPGCGAGDPDPSYPNSSGHIDSFGYDPSLSALPSPGLYYDVMSYCGPSWVSGYNFKSVLNFVAPYGASTQAAAPPRTPSLIVWGKVNATGEMVLEPAFEVTTIPRLPEDKGKFAIEGEDQAGNILFSFKFDGYQVGDGASGERHFSYAIPLSTFDSRRLTTIRIVRDGNRTVAIRHALQSSLDSTNGPVTGEKLRAISGGAELTWNASQHPLVVVRDAVTGQVIAFARNGFARLALNETRQLELIFADGVRSRSKKVPRPE